MGGARQPGPAGPGRAAAGGRAGPGGALRVGARGAAAALGAALACSQLGPDLDSVIAVEIVLPDSGFFAAGDTFHPRARPLNGRGDSVAAPVFWAAADTLVFDVDSVTGATFAELPGAGRIQARVGSLRSDLVTAVAQAPLDTIYLIGNRVVDTVTVSGPPRDTLSDSVQIKVEAPADRMTSAQALLRRRVTYDSIEVFPAGGATITLIPNDTAYTNTSGIVVVQVRLDAGTTPDSVRVMARSFNRGGTDVPGSPIYFVVEFRP